MKAIALIITIFFSTTIFARSIAPNVINFEGQVEAKIEKEYGVTCMAIGCPPAPIFLTLKLSVLDTNSSIKTIDTHLKKTITVDDSEVFFEVDNQKVFDGDQFILDAKLHQYPFGTDYASLVALNKVTFLGDTENIDFSQDVLVSCQAKRSDMAFTIIVEDKIARVWMKDYQDGKLFPIKGKTKVEKFRNKTTRISLRAKQEKVDWDKEGRCWKHNKYPNLLFFFDANGNATVDFHRQVLTDPAAFCVLPMFYPNPELDLDCVQL